jgi:hypothetical protein
MHAEMLVLYGVDSFDGEVGFTTNDSSAALTEVKGIGLSGTKIRTRKHQILCV